MALLILVPSSIIGGHEFQSVEFINQIYKHEKSEISNTFIECGNKKVLNEIEFSDVNKDYFEFPQGSLFSLFSQSRFLKKHLEGIVRNKKIHKVMICGGTIESIIFYSYLIKSINKNIKTIGYVPMVVDKKILRPLIGVLQNIILRLACANVDTVITINRIQAYLIKEFYNKKSLILPNVVDKLPLVNEDRGKRLVYCGRLDNIQKNIINLINLLDRHDNPFKDFIIIGGGPEEQLIRSMCSEAKYINIKMLGWLDTKTLHSHLGCNDVLIMNSRWEGEPLVVREFSSCGLPVIARDIPGFRGVTFKKYRYQSQADLIKILNDNFYSFKYKPSLKESLIASRRERVIAFIIKGQSSEID